MSSSPTGIAASDCAGESVTPLADSVRAFLIWLDGYPAEDVTVSSVADAVTEVRQAANQLRYLTLEIEA